MIDSTPASTSGQRAFNALWHILKNAGHGSHVLRGKGKIDYTYILVRNMYLILAKKENLRRLFAALFLIFLLVEWGSHGALNPSTSSIDEQAISTDEGDYDDPCRSLILCSDSHRKDRQMPNVGHEITQHNALFDRLSAWRSPIGVRDDPLIPFSTAHCLFRPTSPPFHPPELS